MLLVRHPGVIVAGAILGLAGAAIGVWTSIPVYRATATLLLDTSLPTGRMLSELGALMKVPSTVSELVLLRSTPLAELTVEEPTDGRVATPQHPEYARRLGLVTRVDDVSNNPLSTMRRRLLGTPRPEGRLFASMHVPSTGAPSEAPERLVVQFPSADTVRIGLPDRSTPLTGGGKNLVEYPYLPGSVVRYQGVELRLEHLGEIGGKTFAIHHQTREAAARRLVSNVQALEQEKGSGVILVTVDDSDPYRAADEVNALVENYIHMASRRGREKSAMTVSEIEALLAGAESEYAAAQLELVRLKEKYPEAVDTDGSIDSLMEQIKNFETWMRTVRMQREEVQNIIERLQRGELGALSRGGRDLDEPFAQRLVETISRLSAERAQLGRTDNGTYTRFVREQLFKYQEDLRDARAKAEVMRSTLADLEAGNLSSVLAVSAISGASASVASDDPLTQRYLNRYADLKLERDRLEAEYLPTAPNMKENEHALLRVESSMREHFRSRLGRIEAAVERQAEIVAIHEDLIANFPASEERAIETALEQLRQQGLDHLYSRLGGLTGEEEEYRHQLAALNEQLGALPESAAHLARPKIRAELAENSVRMLQASLQEARISHASSVRTADLVSPATPPGKRHTPRTLFNLNVGLMAGTLLGLLVALCLELAQDTLRDGESLAMATGLPLLANIPRALPKAPLALAADPHGVAAETYRSLRAKLRFALGTEGKLRTVGITTSGHNEGKSDANANLAMAFASAGERVLLVDADLRSPNVGRLFGLGAGTGLAEVLGSGAAWTDSVQREVCERLDVLPAGARPSAPGDLLSGSQMDRLIGEWLEHYQVVVFDLPQAAGMADVAALAHKLDGVLVACRAGGPSRRQLVDLVELLLESGASLCGCLLTGTRASSAARVEKPRALRALRKSA